MSEGQTIKTVFGTPVKAISVNYDDGVAIVEVIKTGRTAEVLVADLEGLQGEPEPPAENEFISEGEYMITCPKCGYGFSNE